MKRSRPMIAVTVTTAVICSQTWSSAAVVLPAQGGAGRHQAERGDGAGLPLGGEPAHAVLGVEGQPAVHLVGQHGEATVAMRCADK